MFENLGFGEIALIVLVVILLFGPKRIPDVMQSMGKGLREFKRAMRDVQDEVNKAMDEKPGPSQTKQKHLPDNSADQEIHPASGEKKPEKV